MKTVAVLSTFAVLAAIAHASVIPIDYHNSKRDVTTIEEFYMPDDSYTTDLEGRSAIDDTTVAYSPDDETGVTHPYGDGTLQRRQPPLMTKTAQKTQKKRLQNAKKLAKADDKQATRDAKLARKNEMEKQRKERQQTLARERKERQKAAKAAKAAKEAKKPAKKAAAGQAQEPPAQDTPEEAPADEGTDPDSAAPEEQA